MDGGFKLTVFQERLIQEMTIKNVSQAELARRTKISTGAISKYINIQDRKIDAINMLKIAKALDVNSEWLFGFTDIKKTFCEPLIVDMYEQLSEASKKELNNYALFLLNKETPE